MRLTPLHLKPNRLRPAQCGEVDRALLVRREFRRARCRRDHPPTFGHTSAEQRLLRRVAPRQRDFSHDFTGGEVRLDPNRNLAERRGRAFDGDRLAVLQPAARGAEEEAESLGPAVIVGVDGPEKNTFWERTDDRSRPGHADLHKIGEKIFDTGDVVAMPAGSIHSVVNETDRITLSFHVYGRHLNHAVRSQYDPSAHVEKPFKVRTQ